MPDEEEADADRLFEAGAKAYREGHLREARMFLDDVINRYPASPRANDARVLLKQFLGVGGVTIPGTAPVTDVRVIDFDVKFLRLVWLLVKVSLAMIPAAIILYILYAFVIVVLIGAMGGMGGMR